MFWRTRLVQNIRYLWITHLQYVLFSQQFWFEQPPGPLTPHWRQRTARLLFTNLKRAILFSALSQSSFSLYQPHFPNRRHLFPVPDLFSLYLFPSSCTKPIFPIADIFSLYQISFHCIRSHFNFHSSQEAGLSDFIKLKKKKNIFVSALSLLFRVLDPLSLS